MAFKGLLIYRLYQDPQKDLSDGLGLCIQISLTVTINIVFGFIFNSNEFCVKICRIKVK